MVEHEVGGDAAGDESVDEFIVEGDAFRVYGADAFGKDAGPTDGKAVVLNGEGLHEVEVFFVAVIVIAGGVSGVSVLDIAGLMGEYVPNGRGFTVCVPSAFVLVRGGGNAPHKVFRKCFHIK